MRSSWSDPYLWVHLAGIAAVPVLLELCLFGLATGEPNFAAWFELLFVGSVGILPVFWMQWQRPFCIFSLLAFALKPSQLTDEQRRTLRLFKSPLNQILSVLVAVMMGWVLWRLYQIAPIAAPGISPTANRGVGLLIAAIAFWASNLFLQVPVSVLPVLLTPERRRAALEPYPAAKIPQDFTVPGIRVSQILPPLAQPASIPDLGASTAPETPPTSTTASVNPVSAQPEPVQSSSSEPIDPLVAAVEITEEDAVPDGFEEVTTEDGAEGEQGLDAPEPKQEDLPSAGARLTSTETQPSEEAIVLEPDQPSPAEAINLKEESVVTEEITVETVPQPQFEEPISSPQAQEGEVMETSEAEPEAAAEAVEVVDVVVAEIEEPNTEKWETSEPAQSVSVSEVVAIVEDEALTETYETGISENRNDDDDDFD